MTIDPRALRTYRVVCEQGSITGAAKAMNISQPAISVTIGQLEEYLGTKLFERNRGGILLTPAGRALMRRAEALEALLDVAEEEVELAQRVVQGPFRVGGTPGALANLVPELVAKLTDAGIDHSMHIVVDSDAQLNEMLRKNQLDVAMVTTDIDVMSPDLEEFTIHRDPFNLIVGRANDALPDEMSLKDVVEMNWVLPAAAGAFHRQVSALFLAADARMPRDVIRCDSLLATKGILRDTDYIAILPHGVVTAELNSGELREIKLRGLPVSRNVGLRTLVVDRRSISTQTILETFGLQQLEDAT